MAVTISIGSGKGGTGKTMVAANLALNLARMGRKVCLVDLDLGGADAHILFGLFEPKRTLTDYLTRKVESISDATQTLLAYNGLQLVAGTGDTLHTANISYQEKQRLLRGLQELKAEVIIVDTGAGTGYHALDFFMFSDIQICVTQPDATSIMDFYTFLQLATIRKMLGSFLTQSEVGQSLRSHNYTSLKEVFDQAERSQEGAMAKCQNALRHFHPLLIINRDSKNSGVNKDKLAAMVKKYLGIEIPALGDIPEDPSVTEALKTFVPICDLLPEAKAAKALLTISEKVDKLVALFLKHQQHQQEAALTAGPPGEVENA